MTAHRETTATFLFVLLATTVSPVYAAEGGGNFPRIVNFTIVAALLFFALRGPLSGYLVARTEQIRKELSDAREKSARGEKERQHAIELLASLDDEVEKAKEEAKRAAEVERTRILKAAEAEAERIREIARKEIANEVESGRRKLLARAAELSVSLAHKKLETAMTEEDQNRLIDRSIEILGKSGS